MVISNKPTPETIAISRQKYTINSLLRDKSSNCQTQFYSLEGENVSKLETVISGMIFKDCTSIDEINKTRPNLQYDEFRDMLDKDIPGEILSLLYIISTYTINNCKATAGPKNCTFPELYQYLDQIIPLANKNKIQCLETAGNLKSPDFILDVKIVEAVRLKWKKYLEFSRLFCKIWVSSNQEVVKFTNPIDYPIHPEWNASYRLDIKNPEGDALIIEIRKVIVGKRNRHFHNQKIPSVTEASEGTDETKVTHEKPKDYLFGWSEVRLSKVFCEGIDIWVPVKSIKNGAIKGYLHIVTKIGISKENGRLWALRRHLLLIRLCLEDSLKNVANEKIISSWEEMISPTASSLIYLHSVVEGISVCEDEISWFIVISRIGMNIRSISVQFIHNLLLGCERSLHQLSCVKGSIDCSLEIAFKTEVKNLNKNCLKLIENIHSLDLAENKSHRNDFEYSLRIIKISNEFLKLCDDPITAMKSEAQKWLAKIAENVPMQITDKIQYLIEFTENTKNYLDAADRIIGKVYPDVFYTTTIYSDLDTFLQKYLKDNINDIALELTRMEDLKDQFLMNALRLFESSKYLLLYIKKITKYQIFEEKFESLCVWFGSELIENWFKWKTRVAICQIKMALCFHDLMGINTYRFGFAKEKISSTAKVISDIFKSNLVELWHIVSSTTFSNYDLYFMKSLQDCIALIVAGLLNNSPPVILNADKRKSTRKNLYMVANDLYFLASFVGKITSDTDKSLIADMVDPKALLLDASQKICANICESLLFVAKKRIKNVIEAGNKLNQKLAVINYVSLMDRKIWKEANQYLTSDAFMVFRLIFGQRILEIIQNFVNEMLKDLKSKGKKSKLILEGLLAVSKETEKICLGVGEMYKSQQVWHDEFRELERKIMSIANDNETL